MLHVVKVDNLTVKMASEDRFALDGLTYYFEKIHIKNAIFYEAGVFIISQSGIMEAYRFLLAHLDFFKSHKIIFFICPSSVWKVIEGINDRRFKFIDIHSKPDTIGGFIQRENDSYNIKTSTHQSKRKLTYCEINFIRYYMKGYNPTSIARILGVSIKTVSAHKRAVMRKLLAANVLELLVKYEISKKTKSLFIQARH